MQKNICIQWKNRKVASKQLLHLIVVCTLVFLMNGCSSFQKTSGIDLEKQIARQQAEQELQSESQVQKEMSPHEYERTGDSFLVKGDINRAYYYYVKGLSKDPDNISLLHRQGSLLLKKKRFVEAQPVYHKLLDLNHGDAQALEGMGRVQFGQGKFNEAEYYFTEALKILPDLHLSHEHLGLLYSNKQLYQEAIVRFESALSLQPEDVSIANNLAVTHYLSGNYREAARLFSGLAKVSNNQKIYNNLALSYFQLGMYEEAITAFKKGTEHEAIAYNNMGYEFLTSRQYNQAIKAFEKAISLYPQYYPSAQKNLAIARNEMDGNSGLGNL